MYMTRVVMEDLEADVLQHSPHAAGPKQQHSSSKQHMTACSIHREEGDASENTRPCSDLL